MPANKSIKLGIQVDVNTTQAKKEFDELSKTLTEIQSLAKNPGAMGFEKLSGPVKQATEQARQLEVVFKNAFNADTGLINIAFISLANSFPSSSETLSLSFLSDLFPTSAITNFYYLYIIIFLTCIFR